MAASQTLSDPLAATPAAPAPSTRLCGGCGAPLAAGQKGDARHHGARCRQLAYRARRRAEVLGALDRIGAEVARLRAEVERL